MSKHIKTLFKLVGIYILLFILGLFNKFFVVIRNVLFMFILIQGLVVVPVTFIAKEIDGFLKKKKEKMEEIVFPTRTKIIGRVMQLLGIVLAVTAFYYLKPYYVRWFDLDKLLNKPPSLELFLLLFLPLPLAVLFILFPYFLLKRKKWAWFGSFILLIVLAIAGLIGAFMVIARYGMWNMLTSIEGWSFYLFLSLLIAIISISIPITFFKDRKNFFRIAE